MATHHPRLVGTGTHGGVGRSGVALRATATVDLRSVGGLVEVAKGSIEGLLGEVVGGQRVVDGVLLGAGRAVGDGDGQSLGDSGGGNRVLKSPVPVGSAEGLSSLDPGGADVGGISIGELDSGSD